MPQKIKLAACDEPSTTPDGYDLLLFPDNLRYIGVTIADLPELVKTHLVGGQICAHLRHETISQKYVFVCTHLARDARCGQCGPELARRFTTELTERDLSQQVTVRHSSHVGGHRFAGIVLIYPAGTWYGYVTPNDVPMIIDQHLIGGQAIKSLWRGQMGLSPQEQQAKFNAW
jgi:hypothetical protein